MKRVVDDFRRVRFLGAAALALAAFFTVAACGGGDSTGSGTNASAPVIAKAALIKRGDAICRKTDEVQRVAFEAYKQKHPQEVAHPAGEEKAIKVSALPPIATEIEELAALGTPKGDEQTISALLTELERALEVAEGNPRSVMALSAGPFTKPGKRAERYGFKDCAKPL